MSEFLFEDFNAVSAAAWKQKIQADLKGADYNNSLLWKSNEGITVKPFYHKDTDNTTANLEPNTWRIGELIHVTDALKANNQAIHAIEKGAESIVFKIDSEISITDLVKNIPENKVKLEFILETLSTKLTSEIIKLEHLDYRINVDIIGNLAANGNWHKSLKDDFNYIKTLVSTQQSKPLLSVDTAIYQNAGATITQQLAYAIAHANEYLNTFKTGRLPDIQFITATGGNYFFEIAKIRALKLLFNTILNAYPNNQSKCSILSLPSKRNKTIYDYNVNMLRTTTECMSSILGGAHTICNLPYDALYHESNNFGDRIARNQLLVLKHESAFDSVKNPSDGAYYIESLTQQLAEKALDIFKQIEAGGGFLSQLKEGTIQRKIKESAAKEQSQFDDGNLVLLGTNKYPNENDSIKNDLEKDPFLRKKSRKTLIAPIIAKRLSEATEQKRLETEQ